MSEIETPKRMTDEEYEEYCEDYELAEARIMQAEAICSIIGVDNDIFFEALVNQAGYRVGEWAVEGGGGQAAIETYVSMFRNAAARFGEENLSAERERALAEIKNSMMKM